MYDYIIFRLKEYTYHIEDNAMQKYCLNKQDKDSYDYHYHIYYLTGYIKSL